METGRKWAAVAAIDSIVLHGFSGIRKFTQNIVNTFARTNVYVSAPFLRCRHRWCRFIVFTNSFSSVCAINQCLFGHRRRRATIMHSFSFSARLCRYLYCANSNGRSEYLDVRFSGVVHALISFFQLQSLRMCVAFCIVFFFCCRLLVRSTHTEYENNNEFDRQKQEHALLTKKDE